MDAAGAPRKRRVPHLRRGFNAVKVGYFLSIVFYSFCRLGSYRIEIYFRILALIHNAPNTGSAISSTRIPAGAPTYR